MSEKKTNKNSNRNLAVRLKTAKGRPIASTNWLKRQLNDPYVAKAKREGYRSRAAYKLLEIDKKFNILHKGQIIVDLGAAPGGWTQVAVNKIKGQGKVIAIDLSPMEPIEGAFIIHMDFYEEQAPELIKNAAGSKVDVVMSDMAASACGHTQTDHLRIIALVEIAFDFAKEVLKLEGTFIAKMLRGGGEGNFIQQIKRYFKEVKFYKPPASRADSSETFIIAQGFRNVP